MEVKAAAKYIRISPLKVNRCASLIRNKNINEALTILQFTPQKAAKILLKVLKQLQANAENNFNLDKDNLWIKELIISQGPTMKRYRAGPFGRARLIRKRTTHINVVAEGRE